MKKLLTATALVLLAASPALAEGEPMAADNGFPGLQDPIVMSSPAYSAYASDGYIVTGPSYWISEPDFSATSDVSG